jgi:transposase InsO family protein
MTTLMTRRSWTLTGLVLVAFGEFAAVRAGPPEVSAASREWNSHDGYGLKVPKAPRPAQPRYIAALGFYAAQLAPRMSADYRADGTFVGEHLGDRASTLWTSDPAVIDLVEKRTIRSIADAFKGYAVERLGIDRWSIPLMGRSGRTTPTGKSDGVRFHLGFSRLAPRADFLIPVAAGRVELSVDARGHVSTTFAPASSRFRLAADVDAAERTATVGLSARF